MSTQTAMQVPEWTFGDRIRKIRREAGLSQGEFADRIERGVKSIAAWESGKNEPGDVVTVAKRIQATFGVRADWTLGLMDGHPTPGPGTPSGHSGTSETISYPKSGALLAFPHRDLAMAS